MKHNEDEDFNVPDNAAGDGYRARNFQNGRSSDRWFDNNRKLRIGECVLYQGEACGQFLGGRYIQIMSENQEDVYEIGIFIL